VPCNTNGRKLEMYTKCLPANMEGKNYLEWKVVIKIVVREVFYEGIITPYNIDLQLAS
jgi:hypothetical protein